MASLGKGPVPISSVSSSSLFTFHFCRITTFKLILKHDHSIAKDPEHKPEILGEHWAPFSRKRKTMNPRFMSLLIVMLNPGTSPAFLLPMKETTLKLSRPLMIVVWGQTASLILLGTQREVQLPCACSAWTWPGMSLLPLALTTPLQLSS